MSEIMQSKHNRSIVSTSLHQINVGDKEYKKIPIKDHSDLEDYLTKLLDEITKKEQKREYEFARKKTDFKTTLDSYYIEQILQKNDDADHFAEKLLEIEIKTDESYGHLGKDDDGVVKKGSFLQFMYIEDKELFYLGVKIEHQEFLDENDFKKKVGLSVANKVYKACHVSYDKNLPKKINIYDTNTKPARYWWDSFFELKVIRDDALNTKEASQKVVNSLGKYKKDFPKDYTHLRNAVITAFKQKGEMNYDDFIENIFVNYVSDDETFNKKLEDLIKKLKELPEKEGFDTKFTLDPSEVSFKRQKVQLSGEIDINYDEDMKQIDDKIWSEIASDGRKLVVINSEKDSYKNFKIKVREK
jgi:hypothetical protein